jgi:hypothetical protein
MMDEHWKVIERERNALRSMVQLGSWDPRLGQAAAQTQFLPQINAGLNQHVEVGPTVGEAIQREIAQCQDRIKRLEMNYAEAKQLGIVNVRLQQIRHLVL